MKNTHHKPVCEFGPRDSRDLQQAPSDDGEVGGCGGILPSTDGDRSTDVIFSMVNTDGRPVLSAG